MFKKVLNQLMDGKTLTESEAASMMDMIMTGEASKSQIASFLSIIRYRGETTSELTGFTRSMRSHALTLVHDEDVMDTCGTGGDGASTFNISTASAILLSSMGVKVAKHGNRAVSSKSGSADVLEQLGIPTQTTTAEAVRSLKENDMCFLFAPLYHGSMKHAAGPRQELGFRTTFNILGPLVNPADSQKQLIGVYDHELARKMAETLVRLGTKRSLFVTGAGGLDEVAVYGKTEMILVDDGRIEAFSLTPEEVGLERGPIEAIQVNNVKESAELIEAIFSGEAETGAVNTLLLNAGCGLYVYGKAKTIAEGVHEARNALVSGRAYRHLESLRTMREMRHHA
ncbi:anthranilate phosphoribosyltransferase [Scopulibacillus darangshiensis]|uniref:Anthranilate phosphoribosyltransferase n=1 Tax=Scopulibacillus darangshiensis TaxID=442528 RepID=A0A4R2P9D6_9BACL|nr:anthranilate phosphoribosyltransferase [Scopulibacillus darangshiensis]TCP31639.1 anthranilate phosphoribosyltransferase [Scopulibacillus darangshiensis]